MSKWKLASPEPYLGVEGVISIAKRRPFWKPLMGSFFISNSAIYNGYHHCDHAASPSATLSAYERVISARASAHSASSRADMATSIDASA